MMFAGQYMKIIYQRGKPKRHVLTYPEIILTPILKQGGSMQSIDNKSVLNPLCSPIYRYSGQPIYAVHEVVDKSLEIIRQLHSQPHTVTGYPTGLTDLDYLLSGLQPGSLTVIASRPSMGKSALALNIIQSRGCKIDCVNGHECRLEVRDLNGGNERGHYRGTA